jgi:hypothetical protein
LSFQVDVTAVATTISAALVNLLLLFVGIVDNLEWILIPKWFGSALHGFGDWIVVVVK